MADEILSIARRCAESSLFPTALATDASDLVPVENLDLLAGAGLYGLVGPAEAGGLGSDLGTACRVIETLAGACLTTTFVWRQHLGAVLTVAGASSQALRDAWLPALCRGRKRAGIALAGALPGPPILTARRVAEGWILDGRAPWVTGWGRIDVIAATARDAGNDRVVRVLVDAVEDEHLRVELLRIVAVQASGTVHLSFDGLFVPDGRLIATEPYQEGSMSNLGSLKMNGALSLGVASRCCTLLGATALDGELAERRAALLTATEESIGAARAACSELAIRAAAAAVVACGSRSILASHHAQRLAREAIFLLVFGQRPAIHDALLKQLGV
jgi:alkylation response protein AidB-like acyl-CoA dehydrogenase